MSEKLLVRNSFPIVVLKLHCSSVQGIGKMYSTLDKEFALGDKLRKSVVSHIVVVSEGVFDLLDSDMYLLSTVYTGGNSYDVQYKDTPELREAHKKALDNLRNRSDKPYMGEDMLTGKQLYSGDDLPSLLEKRTNTDLHDSTKKILENTFTTEKEKAWIKGIIRGLLPSGDEWDNLVLSCWGLVQGHMNHIEVEKYMGGIVGEFVDHSVSTMTSINVDEVKSLFEEYIIKGLTVGKVTPDHGEAGPTKRSETTGKSLTEQQVKDILSYSLKEWKEFCSILRVKNELPWTITETMDRLTDLKDNFIKEITPSLGCVAPTKAYLHKSFVEFLPMAMGK